MCGLENISSKLPSYEKEVAKELIKWMNEPPGKITSALNKVVDGIANGIEEVVPKAVADKITKYIIDLLELLQDLSSYTFPKDAKVLRRKIQDKFGKGQLSDILVKVILLMSGAGVVQKARELGFRVKTIQNLQALELKQIDKLVGKYMGIFGNKGLATLEGGLTGLGGFTLLLVDIPIITAINFRYIQQIATCFGYDQDMPQEKIFAKRVFMLAFGGNSGLREGLGAKIAAAYELKVLAFALARKWTYAEMAKHAGLRSVLVWLKKSAPRQLAKYVTKRKAATVIPFFGAGIGGGINYVMTSYTGKVGWYCYRYRKLIEDFGTLGGDKMSLDPS
jgi:hypothetical protein